MTAVSRSAAIRAIVAATPPVEPASAVSASMPPARARAAPSSASSMASERASPSSAATASEMTVSGRASLAARAASPIDDQTARMIASRPPKRAAAAWIDRLACSDPS
jgi:hypothetical protein